MKKRRLLQLINRVAMTGSDRDRLSAAGALCCAFRFLTILPLAWMADRDGELFPRSVVYFPLVGLTVGGGGVLLCKISATVLPIEVIPFVALVYLAAISGFLHLDGLADSGDGLLSHRSREASLSIMKDSRSGAMGVVVLIMVLLGKFTALSTLTFSQLMIAVFLMPLAGRVAIVCSMAFFPYARQEGGLGGLFYSSRMRRLSVGALALLAVSSWVVGNPWLVVSASFGVVGLCWLFGSFCRQRIGGMTGDTLGAVCELAEMVTAFIVCAAIV